MIKFKKVKRNYRMTMTDLQLAKEKIKNRITRLHKIHGKHGEAKTGANN